jgi:succinate-semialdehyde dehydrogenase / glutarate-semialdehyde dehydrogenase
MPAGLDDPSLLRQQCLVDGEWTGAPADAVHDPATGEVVAHVPRMGAADTHAAIDAAARAFTVWSSMLASERGAALRRWADLIVQHASDLARIMTAEQGKPLAEARGEVLSAAGYIAYYGEESRRIGGEVMASHRADSRIMVVHQPIGVVGAITPWNFPAGMIARKVGPALAAGCTVVLKPAPETPLTALALAELGQRAGLPPGALNVLTGDAVAIGQALFEAPAVRFIGFTGSTATGKQLMRQAADGVKRLGLELGGHAPFIVLDDADLDAAVEGAMASKFRNMGQTCVAANRFWLHEKIHDAFLESLIAKVRALRVGPGTEDDVSQGPLINERAVLKVERHVANAIEGGARLHVGGRRHALGGRYYEPTVLSSVTDGMEVAMEETFGPVAAITRFNDDRQMLERVNASNYGLAAYVYGRDIGRVLRMAEQLEYGMVGINAVALGTELAPIGGVKHSGIGREGSHHGILEYCEMKYMLVGGL